MILVYPSKSKAKYKIEVLIRHLAANAGYKKVDTRFICNDGIFLLEHMDKAEAKYELLNFVMLWRHAKNEMPLCDPELIEEFIKPVSEAGIGNMSDEAVRTKVTSFFKKKWESRNEDFSFPSQGFLLATELFLKQPDRFLDRFPQEEVQKIAELMDKFYSSQNTDT